MCLFFFSPVLKIGRITINSRALFSVWLTSKAEVLSISQERKDLIISNADFHSSLIRKSTKALLPYYFSGLGVFKPLINLKINKWKKEYNNFHCILCNVVLLVWPIASSEKEWHTKKWFREQFYNFITLIDTFINSLITGASQIFAGVKQMYHWLEGVNFFVLFGAFCLQLWKYNTVDDKHSSLILRTGKSAVVTHAVQCRTVTDSSPQPGVPPPLADDTQQKKLGNWGSGNSHCHVMLQCASLSTGETIC